jgi:hypothetical protein
MTKKRKNNEIILSLDERLASIGILVSTRALSQSEIDGVDIEETLAAVASALSLSENQRILAPVLAWISINGSSVIVEKLAKILKRTFENGINISYSALMARFAVTKGHKRWRILTKWSPDHLVVVGPPRLAESLLALRGEESWSQGTGFIVPKGSLNPESKWTLSRETLAEFNLQYKNRLLYGAQWRADIITAYERGAKNPTEASRMSGASYEPCHRIMADLKDAGKLTLANRPKKSSA